MIIMIMMMRMVMVMVMMMMIMMMMILMTNMILNYHYLQGEECPSWPPNLRPRHASQAG